MLELANQSHWAAGIYPGWGKDKNYQYTLVVKQSFNFELTGELVATNESTVIRQQDEYHGDPLQSSLKSANEVAPFKQGSEIIIVGTAYPHKPQAKASPVKVEIKGDTLQWKKELVVSGTRIWTKGFLGLKASEARILKPTPLTYEFSYGGSHPENEEIVVETNPAGMGYVGKGKNIENVKLPQIEAMDSLISSPKDTPVAAGFAPIAPFWSPRDQLNQDINEQAARNGDCHYGNNVPDNLHHCAPEDQQFSQAFTGKEMISLSGFFESVRSINLRLALETPDMILLDSEQEEYLTPVLDTIIINTDVQTVECLWRCAIPHERTETEIGWVYVRDEATTQQLEQEFQTA
ncbi:hypothetical protein MNBD_GAMMA12-2743 [hydrothermal vent metagenome]|uniref:DUF2169 domain-containing protein n=1 Tax=hydrothermal vent metagenome TaxID=652676 RepID=A0A3B0YB92_9ZZZZ